MNTDREFVSGDRGDNRQNQKSTTQAAEPGFEARDDRKDDRKQERGTDGKRRPAQNAADFSTGSPIS